MCSCRGYSIANELLRLPLVCAAKSSNSLVLMPANMPLMTAWATRAGSTRGCKPYDSFSIRFRIWSKETDSSSPRRLTTYIPRPCAGEDPPKRLCEDGECASGLLGPFPPAANFPGKPRHTVPFSGLVWNPELDGMCILPKWDVTSRGNEEQERKWKPSLGLGEAERSRSTGHGRGGQLRCRAGGGRVANVLLKWPTSGG